MKPKDLSEFKSIIDVIAYFNDESFNLKYLEALRWGDNPICPHCEHDKSYRFNDEVRFKCAKCRKIFNAKTKSMYQGTKITLQQWFLASYIFLTSSKGITSLEMAERLGVTHKTGYQVLNKIRMYMERNANTEESVLFGIIEVDETFVGGKNKNRHKHKKIKYNKQENWKGKKYPDKVTVIGVKQRNGEVRCRAIDCVTRLEAQPFLFKHVHEESLLMSDICNAYFGMEVHCEHRTVNHSGKEYVRGYVHTNGIESFWAIVKRAIIGVYYKVSRKYTNRYIQEFVFRFNTRKLSKKDRFERLIRITGNAGLYKQKAA